MSNKTYFVTSVGTRMEVALCVRRIVEATISFLGYDDDKDARQDMLRDLTECQEINFSLVAYGTITEDNVNFIVERHDGMELWSADVFADNESNLRKLLGGE